MRWSVIWITAVVLFAALAALVWLVPPVGAALAGGVGISPTQATFALVVAALLSLAGLAWSLGRLTREAPLGTILETYAETGPEGVMLSTPDGAVRYVNAAFRALFAFETAPAGRVHDMETALADDEDSRDAFRRLVAAAESGVAAEADLAVVSTQGVEWRRVQVRPVAPFASPGDFHENGDDKTAKKEPSDDASADALALWRAHDVTAELEFEAVRRHEEDLLADFLDRLPVGFFSVDGEGRIVYANETLAGWLGISPQDLAADLIPFSEFVVEAEEVDGTDAPATDGAPAVAHGRVMLRTARGDTFKAWLMQSEQVGDGGEPLYSRSVVMRDMIWRPEGSAPDPTLSDERLHWLFDEAPVGIVLLNLQGEMTDCNQAFVKLIGQHRDDLLGQPFSECLVKEDRADVAGQLSKVVMGILRAAHLEVRMPAPGQREVTTSLYASRMEDDIGEVSGLILHFIDTTEQKHLEIQFAQSQKMQAVGQLAGGVAHDFNNLLTAMTGFCDLLLTRHGAGDPSFADIMQIKQNANRATNLVRQLLAFSRKQRLEPEILDPAEMLSDLTNLLGRLIGANIELMIEDGRDVGLIRADRGQFDQVIINLAVNARDAMPGGGTLTIRTSAFELDEPVQRGHELLPEGSYVLIEVMDTGTGISKENLGSIFEPFFSTKGVGEGTGLGLSTVYGIVHQSDGYIFVDSAPGEGTTFSICLPRHEQTGARSGAGDAGGIVRSRRPSRPQGEDTIGAAEDLTGAGTVLLVEDEDAVRMFAAKALRGKGYHVLEASDGEMALDVINANEGAIDLIISDVVMPGMDGHTLVQLVRQELNEVKVILISGYADDVIPGGLDQDSTIHFLPKPFTLTDLAGKVKDVLAG